MSILDEVVNAAKERTIKFAEKVGIKDVKKREYDDYMTKLGNECREIITDPRYKNQQEYFDRRIEELIQGILYALVVDIKNLNKQDTLSKACAIASQLYVYREWKGWAKDKMDMVIDHEKNLKKEIEK